MINKKIIFNILLVLAGAVLIYTGGFILTGEEIKSVSGVCIGVGSGLIGMNIAHIIIAGIEVRNPSIARKKNIDEKDERNILIRNTAKGKAFDAMGILLAILMLAYLLIDADLLVIFLLVGAYLLMFGIYMVFLSKYLKEM